MEHYTGIKILFLKAIKCCTGNAANVVLNENDQDKRLCKRQAGTHVRTHTHRRNQQWERSPCLVW